jgi:hypothetical protein
MIEEKIRAEQSLPPLSAIQEYRSAAEKFFSSNTSLKLLPEQKNALKKRRATLKIKKEEAHILEHQARENLKRKRHKQ